MILYVIPMPIKHSILLLTLLLTYSLMLSANEADLSLNETASENYYQTPNKNTVLILKETATFFKNRPLNSFFVSKLQWATDLEKKIKKDLSFYNVLSKEITETVSSKALETISKAIESEKPKVVVIALGENDGLFSKTIKEIRQYLAAIIKTAENNNATVVLVGNRLPLHYGLQYTNNFVQMYAELAELYDLAYVPKDKISYTYPLFLYSYSPIPAQTLPLEDKSSDKIWQEVDKIISREKKNSARLPGYYRYPDFVLEAYQQALYQ
jgi:hypothetical protein